MFARLKALASSTDLMTMVAIAAVGWGISQLTKTVQERQQAIGEMTAAVGELGAEIGRRQARIDELAQVERAHYEARDAAEPADEPLTFED